jgi:Domain of unknown function (DUF4184)
MPFTLIHPIATVPIWFGSKYKLHLASLAIGAMIPDADYFLFLYPVKTIGHTFYGIFIQGIPYSIVLLLTIRYVIMRPFLALIPLQIARKFPPSKKYFPPQFFDLTNVIISIAIGATTHLIWDDFDLNGSSSIVQTSEFLKSMISSLQSYKLLLYCGGIVGLVCLSLWLVNWIARSPSYHRAETLNPWWRVTAIVGIVYCAFGVAWFAVQDNREPFVNSSVRFLIGGISGIFLGFLLYSVIFWLLNGLNSNSSET